MSDGTHGHATTLTGGTAGLIGNIISMTGPNQTRDAIDISTMDSTSKFREFIPGMIDAGEITFEINYDAVDAQTAEDLDTALSDATPETWTIVFAGVAATYGQWACSGFVTALSFGNSFDDKITQSVTIKFTGVPTYSSAT